MTAFSSPAYATMLSDRDVLLLGQKAQSFHSVLASAILSDNCLCYTWTLLLMHLAPFSRVSVSPLSSLSERGGERVSKLNDDTCRTFAVSTLEPSLHKGCNSPSAERLYSPLFVLNPKGTASCGPLHQGVVRWAESGGWFNESVMSFLGCLILGLPPPSLHWMSLKCIFANIL
jgi:hypothetical protein